MIWSVVCWLLCIVGFHDWTSKFDQGINPNMEEAKRDPTVTFWDWSAVYCKRCEEPYD